MTSDVFEQIKLFLPKYLTPQQTKDLYEELTSFPNFRQFYLHRSDLQDELLQGDGWSGLVVINFSSCQSKSIKGLVLSNSCDVSSENRRILPVNLVFAPIVSFSRFIERLRTRGLSSQQIESQLSAIRNQQLTSVFYLPEADGVIDESLVFLDDLHAEPLEYFLNNEKAPLFTLSQHAFYVFIIKLSIHFCRFQEGVNRF